MYRRLLEQFSPARQPNLGPLEAPRTPIPWLRLALWFWISRALIFAMAWASLKLVPPGYFFSAPRSIMEWLIRWDAGWFRDVIQNGYIFHPDRPSNVNFLPMYPLLVRLFTWALSAELAGYLVTFAVCFAGGALLWRLTERIDGRAAAADGAVLFFFFGPVNVFFATLYSEATFVTAALLCIYAAYRDRWVLAGLLGACAALSRSVGVFLVIPLAILCVQRHARWRDWTGVKPWLRLVACGLPVLGTIAFAAYCGWKFGEPRAYVISHAHAGQGYLPFSKLFKSGHFLALPTFYQVWFALAVAVGLLLTAAGALLRQPLAFTLFALALCLLYVSMGNLEGMPRFMSIVFPFYCTLGQLWARWPRLGGALLAVSVLASLLSVALFVNGYWFT